MHLPKVFRRHPFWTAIWKEVSRKSDASTTPTDPSHYLFLESRDLYKRWFAPSPCFPLSPNFQISRQLSTPRQLQVDFSISNKNNPTSKEFATRPCFRSLVKSSSFTWKVRFRPTFTTNASTVIAAYHWFRTRTFDWNAKFPETWFGLAVITWNS